MIGGVETGVSKPTADDSHIDTGGDHMNSHRMTEAMRRDLLTSERTNLLCGGANILIQLEAEARSAQRFSVTVNKDRLCVGTRLALEQRFEQVERLGPEWTKSLFASLAKETDMGRGLESDGLRTHVECFLDASPRIVEKAQ